MRLPEFVTKGLSQLEAYIDAEEGVAFQMDNGLIWDSLGLNDDWTIKGVIQQEYSSKFSITTVPSGKVILKNWRGKILAPRSRGINPDIYPLLPVSFSFREDLSLQFEVFYRKKKIAFQASNGLFLARVYRSFHTIEAAKSVADDTCLFIPMIGDMNPPKIEIIQVVSSDTMPLLYRSTVDMKTFTNTTDSPQTHSFTMRWETTVQDKVTWEHLWGLGTSCLRWFRIDTMRAKVKYTWNNKKKVSVKRNILEIRIVEVVVPSKNTCTVHLHAHSCDNVTVPFTATIRKLKSNGDEVILSEKGKWTGLLYSDILLSVKIEPLHPPFNHLMKLQD